MCHPSSTFGSHLVMCTGVYDQYSSVVAIKLQPRSSVLLAGAQKAVLC